MTMAADDEPTSAPMGWVVIEFPQEHLIGKVVIYTIDSPEYPAQKYGVNSVQLQYWIQYKYAGMEVKGWKNINRSDKRIGQQFDSIRGNTEGKIVFRFKPVSTSKIRLLVLWTNDSEKYKVGTEEYRRGAVRLIEIEVFGYEKKKDGGTVARGSEPSKEDELSEALSVKPTQPEEEIELTVKAYEQAYRDRNLTALMATISPNYSRDGETYQQLETQMRSLFENYSKIEFQLQGLKVFQKAPNATAEANYSVKLEGSEVKQLSLSGKLFFTLSKGDDAWKITRIDTQKQLSRSLASSP
jgi:ketosteroid isomerase-like protein